MSHIISIIRSEESPKGPLTEGDLAGLAAGDASLRYDPADKFLAWTGHPEGQTIGFDFEDGRLQSQTTPDDETYDKMELIARGLDAILEDESGARSTDGMLSGVRMPPILVAIVVIFAFSMLILLVFKLLGVGKQP